MCRGEIVDKRVTKDVENGAVRQNPAGKKTQRRFTDVVRGLA